MPEVQEVSVKQIDLSLESAHPGDLKASYSCLCTKICPPAPAVPLIPVDSTEEKKVPPALVNVNKADHPAVRSDRIIKRQDVPYLYIASGDFAIVWPNVIVFTIASILYIVSIYAVTTTKDVTLQKTWIFTYFIGTLSGLGITAGAHRLWSHRSYKAKLPLRILLMIFQCIAGQNSLYVWCRDHRVHHKFSETDADPHNSNRGFFFAHVGWLMRKKHPSLKLASDKMQFQDLLDDPVVRFQKDNYALLYLIFAVVLPVAVPIFMFGEIWYRSVLLAYFLRYLSSLHCTWFVNSTAHMFGIRPFNTKIQARENAFVAYAAFGEGYHNFHHTFPFDYRTSEDGTRFNLSRHFIDLCSRIGQAYDLKKVSVGTIESSKSKILAQERAHHSDEQQPPAGYSECHSNSLHHHHLHNHPDLLSKQNELILSDHNNNNYSNSNSNNSEDDNREKCRKLA